MGSGSGGEVTASDIYQYFYCRRKVYFMHVSGIAREVRPKMELGSEVHSEERRRLFERAGAYGVPWDRAREVRLNACMRDEALGLSGCADAVVVDEGGTAHVVELKLTDMPEPTAARRAQLYAYAHLVMSSGIAKRVRAYIYYVKQRRLEEVRLPGDLEEQVRRAVEWVRAVMSSESIPPASEGPRCSYCEYRWACRP